MEIGAPKVAKLRKKLVEVDLEFLDPLGGEEVWMCTGDHSTTACAVAEELGIHPEKVP